MSEGEGRWAVEVPKSEEAMCAATDPSADYRWQPLPCSGPTVAAFICQMNVPSWAQNEKGCMLTSLPSLTVTFLPEQGAVELISDCGLEGTRRISCKGQANREEMIRQLACETTTGTEATQAETTDETLPTRHRRGSEPTTPTSPVINTTQEMTVTEEITTISTENTETDSNTISTDTTTPRPVSTESPTSGPGQMEVAVEIQEAGSKVAIKRTFSSKPIPPSLRGNSPFVEPIKNITEEPVPLESHEALGGEAEVPSSVSPGTHSEMEEYKKNVQDSGEDHTETVEHLSTEQTLNTSNDDQTTILPVEPADQPLSDEPDPPERPNRGRLLIHPQHHSFYAYFLNRVLG